MAAATLPPAESGSWHFEHTARPPASMSLVTRVVSWLAWQDAQDRMSLVTNSGACALFWNISDESAWHLPHVRASRSGSHRRLRVVDRTRVVVAVAVHARGRDGVAAGGYRRVNAGSVELGLIHALLRIVLLHEGGVAVAPAAELGHPRAGHPHQEAA